VFGGSALDPENLRPVRIKVMEIMA
jgi:hypothetical protein